MEADDLRRHVRHERSGGYFLIVIGILALVSERWIQGGSSTLVFGVAMAMIGGVAVRSSSILRELVDRTLDSQPSP